MSELEGLIAADKLIQPGRELSESTIMALKKQELDYLVAPSCLRGTLAGALLCLPVIVLIVASPAFTTRNIIQDWEVVAIVIAMIVAIVVYGVFIFNRALTFNAKNRHWDVSANITDRVEQLENTLRGGRGGLPRADAKTST